MKRLVLCVAGLLTMAAVGNAFGADTNDAVAWGEPSNGLQAGLSLKSTSMEPKPSATFVLTVRNVGKKPVRILNVSSYVQHYGIHLEIRSAGTNMPSIYPKFKKSSPPETDYITLNAGDADSTEVTLKLEDWKLSPPFDAEVVFVFKSDLRERSFPVNAEQDRGQSKTVAGLWTGEARSKAVSMKMATEGDKKAVVLPARNAQAATNWTDSADGKVSVCFFVDKNTFTADEPIVIRCAVRNNTKEPLFLLRPFGDAGYALQFGLHISGSKGQIRYTGSWTIKDYGLGTGSFQELPAGKAMDGTLELRKSDFPGLEKAGTYTMRYDYVSGRYPTQPKPKNFWEGTVTSGEVQVQIAAGKDICYGPTNNGLVCGIRISEGLYSRPGDIDVFVKNVGTNSCKFWVSTATYLSWANIFVDGVQFYPTSESPSADRAVGPTVIQIGPGETKELPPCNTPLPEGQHSLSLKYWPILPPPTSLPTNAPLFE
ncbi:MAG: hypothetical protein WCP86_09625, partial [bacterium]